MIVPDETRRTFSEVPANQHLGFQLVSQSDEEAVVTFEAAPHHGQETGVVHGGFLSAVADTAAVYVLHPYLRPNQNMASIEFKVNFLRPATVDGGAVVARAQLLHRGRRVGVCEVEVSQAETIVAKGTFTYLFFEKQ